MTVDSGATIGGPEIVDSRFNITGTMDSNTSDTLDGSKPNMAPASTMSSEINFVGHTK
jgi:hypothetical protein